MRTDLTVGFEVEKDKKANKPANVIEMTWPEVNGNPATTLYLSDTPLTIGAQVYMNLIEDFGPIDLLYDDYSFVDKSVGDQLVSLLNVPADFGSGLERLSKFMIRYTPEAATCNVYQYFRDASLGASDLAPMFKAELEVDSWDESRITLRLIQIARQYGRRSVGNRIDKTTYPNAPESVVGKPHNIVIGTVSRVPGYPVRKINTTRLTGVALTGDSTLKVESTDAFPSSGTLLLNDDEVTYAGKTATTFTGCSGINILHYAGDQVAEEVTDFRFVFSDPAYPIEAIDVVYAGEETQSGVTIDLPKAEAIFTSPPRKTVSLDTKFLQAQFDTAASGNTAVNPARALVNHLDVNNGGGYAEINQLNSQLSLQQTTAMANRGIIGRVLLRVVHWAEERLSNDNVSAQIRGEGTPFNLSPPAADDTAAVSGNTDITHPTPDTFGFPIDVPQPPITTTTNADDVLEQEATGGLGRGIQVIGGTTQINITFPPNPSGSTKTEIRLGMNVQSGIFGGQSPIFKLGNPTSPQTVATWDASRGNFDFLGGVTINGAYTSTTVRFNLPANMGSWVVDLLHCSRFVYYPHGTFSSQGPQNTSKQGSNQIVTGTKSLSSTTDKSSNTFTDLFDITDLVNGDWNWFSNKIVDIKYNGNQDGRTVFIVHTAFEIEFTRRQLEITDDVYGDIRGLIDDGTGTVTGTPSLRIERPDHFFRWTLLPVLGLTAGDINSASFATAGTEFQNVISGGYKFNGIVSGGSTLQSVWSRAMFEGRCSFRFDPLGKASLRFKPLNDSTEVIGQEVKEITASMIRRLKGSPDAIRFSRSPTRNVVNKILLNYSRVWGTDNYANNVMGQDADSIAIFGVRDTHPSIRFDSDFSISEVQSLDLLEFYLSHHKAPSVLVQAEAFLDQLELEPGDIVQFTHTIDGYDQVFAELLPGTFNLGSGKARRMDSISLRFRLFPIGNFRKRILEVVTISETVTAQTLFDRILNDGIEVDEAVKLLVALGTIGEGVAVDEALNLAINQLNPESVEVSEEMLIEALVKTQDAVKVSETAYKSFGGWGQSGWGQFPWGDREVI